MNFLFQAFDFDCSASNGDEDWATNSYCPKDYVPELGILKQNQGPPPPSAAELHGFACNDQLLLDLINRTGYSITQRNGQRIYGYIRDRIYLVNKHLAI